jgi:hypothetical protein
MAGNVSEAKGENMLGSQPNRVYPLSCRTIAAGGGNSQEAVTFASFTGEMKKKNTSVRPPWNRTKPRFFPCLLP